MTLKDTSSSNFPTYKRNDFKFIRSEQKSHSDSEITNSRVNHAGCYTFVKNSSNSSSPRKHQSFTYKWGRTESKKAEFNNKFKYVKNGELIVPNFSLEHRKVPTRIMTYSRVFNKTEKSAQPLKNKAFQSNAHTHVPRKDAVTILSKYKLVKDHKSAVAPKHLLKYSKKPANVSPKKIGLSKYSYERQGNMVGNTSSFIRRRYKVVKRRRSSSKTINQQVSFKKFWSDSLEIIMLGRYLKIYQQYVRKCILNSRNYIFPFRFYKVIALSIKLNKYINFKNYQRRIYDILNI